MIIMNRKESITQYLKEYFQLCVKYGICIDGNRNKPLGIKLDYTYHTKTNEIILCPLHHISTGRREITANIEQLIKDEDIDIQDVYKLVGEELKEYYNYLDNSIKPDEETLKLASIFIRSEWVKGKENNHDKS